VWEVGLGWGMRRKLTGLTSLVLVLAYFRSMEGGSGVLRCRTGGVPRRDREGNQATIFMEILGPVAPPRPN
jgi:hypothetical protein